MDPQIPKGETLLLIQEQVPGGVQEAKKNLKGQGDKGGEIELKTTMPVSHQKLWKSPAVGGEE